MSQNYINSNQRSCSWRKKDTCLQQKSISTELVSFLTQQQAVGTVLISTFVGVNENCNLVGEYGSLSNENAPTGHRGVSSMSGKHTGLFDTSTVTFQIYKLNRFLECYV